ncbi:MAG: N(4)-(beta-N-acetylglucosaminyl)-L-asparaginase [Chlorobi bacterium]|nr:N(4)-(beta-N-acetylglucosaminyl)-L-asparaginase [Chlorobiota bacterium]
MKIPRRKFIVNSVIISGSFLTSKIGAAPFLQKIRSDKKELPLIISTWSHGFPASKQALEVLNSEGNLLDAITGGINIVEDDPENHSVGLGGFPDAEGHVTLDASIMDWNGNAGAVSYLEGIKNPINIARLVMEKTKHVMLSGKGAQEFAVKEGYEIENLLTPEIKKDWEKWKLSDARKMLDPVLGSRKNHDTIGLLAIDKTGNISGGVSTSGWAYKLPGRVGDSPIIGAGLYVDNEIGAACSTGLGERVIETVGSFLIVEMMRQGYSPLEAIKIAIDRLKKRMKNHEQFQVAYIALNKNGEYAGYALRPDFEYAAVTNNYAKMIKTEAFLEWKK